VDKRAKIEAILFAAGEPVKLERLAQAGSLDIDACAVACDTLADAYAYEQRGMRIVRTGDSYQMVSAPQYAPLIRETLEERKPPLLSKPAMEVLSIVAYHQPTTRAVIEQIRGVDSSGTVGTLCDKGLIEECGKLEVPGRPRLYRTTHNFLRCFGLKTLDDLPEVLPSTEVQSDDIAVDSRVSGCSAHCRVGDTDSNFGQVFAIEGASENRGLPQENRAE